MGSHSPIEAAWVRWSNWKKAYKETMARTGERDLKFRIFQISKANEGGTNGTYETHGTHGREQSPVANGTGQGKRLGAEC